MSFNWNVIHSSLATHQLPKTKPNLNFLWGWDKNPLPTELLLLTSGLNDLSQLWIPVIHHHKIYAWFHVIWYRHLRCFIFLGYMGSTRCLETEIIVSCSSSFSPLPLLLLCILLFLMIEPSSLAKFWTHLYLLSDNTVFNYKIFPRHWLTKTLG